MIFFDRPRPVETFPMEQVAEIASELAMEAGVYLRCSLGDGDPPLVLTIAPRNQEEAATLVVSALDPGVVAVELGRGLRGEFTLKRSQRPHELLPQLRSLIGAVIAGAVVERVSRVGAQRVLLRGTIRADGKTYRWWRLMPAPTLQTGTFHYKPYAV